MTTLADPEGEPAYYTADWWFDWSEDKNIILDHLVQAGGPGVTEVTTRCDWARVLYHECVHPATTRDDCEWGIQRDYGPVPDHIETMD